MVDLSSFSDSCAYCYSGIKEGLDVCECGISLCENHKDLHFSKASCHSLYSLSFDKDGKVVVKASFDTKDIEERINIKVKHGMNSFMTSKECLHIYGSKNIKKKLNKEDVRCNHCEITENIWICSECGHMGCGRQQEGAVGNGHAIQHFKNTGHGQSILSSSISDGHGDTFCYSCDDFISNPYVINIEIKDNDIKSFEDLSGQKDKISVPSNILGIVNEGLTCYISSVLHLLNEIVKNIDLSDHFLLCESNPMNCICCQLIKIFNEDRSIKNQIKAVRITGFLKCFFNEHSEFSFKKQEDSSEFLYCILESLKNYESCMLFPSFSHLIEYSITEINECKNCGKRRTDCSKNSILYLPFSKSLKASFDKYFEPSSVPCECDGRLERKSFFETVPSHLIIALGRHKYENGNYIKIEDEIGLDSFKVQSESNTEVKNFNLNLKGAIIHKGKETSSGHYTWWIKDENDYFVANDDIVSRSDEKCPRQGNVFLLESKECIS